MLLSPFLYVLLVSCYTANTHMYEHGYINGYNNYTSYDYNICYEYHGSASHVFSFHIWNDKKYQYSSGYLEGHNMYLRDEMKREQCMISSYLDNVTSQVEEK